jgi:L-fuconolactonase
MLAVLDPHIHIWAPRTTPQLLSPVVKSLGWSAWALRNLGPRMLPSALMTFVGKTDFVFADYLCDDWQRDAGQAVAGVALRPTVEAGHDGRGFIHVQAGWTTKGPLGPAEETRWLENNCGPTLRGIVGHAALESDSLVPLLDAHAKASPRFVGIRDMLANDDDRGVVNFDEKMGRCSDPAWHRGFAELGHRNLNFDAWMYHTQLSAFEKVVRAHPDTRVVLDHLGTPIGYGGPYAGYGHTKAARQEIAKRWRDDLAALAGHPQVHAKISGLTMPVLGWGFHEQPTPPSRAQLVDCLGPMVETALELFGAQRCMFASNFPMDKVSAPWTSLYEVFDELTRTRDEAERKGLFHDNAARVYRLAGAA